jgi:hypothetical protein
MQYNPYPPQHQYGPSPGYPPNTMPPHSHPYPPTAQGMSTSAQGEGNPAPYNMYSTPGGTQPYGQIMTHPYQPPIVPPPQAQTMQSPNDSANPTTSDIVQASSLPQLGSTQEKKIDSSEEQVLKQESDETEETIQI